MKVVVEAAVFVVIWSIFYKFKETKIYKSCLLSLYCNLEAVLRKRFLLLSQLDQFEPVYPALSREKS
jgi:hypothetical protein